MLLYTLLTVLPDRLNALSWVLTAIFKAVTCIYFPGNVLSVLCLAPNMCVEYDISSALPVVFCFTNLTSFMIPLWIGPWY